MPMTELCRTGTIVRWNTAGPSSIGVVTDHAPGQALWINWNNGTKGWVGREDCERLVKIGEPIIGRLVRRHGVEFQLQGLSDGPEVADLHLDNLDEDMRRLIECPDWVKELVWFVRNR